MCHYLLQTNPFPLPPSQICQVRNRTCGNLWQCSLCPIKREVEIEARMRRGEHRRKDLTVDAGKHGTRNSECRACTCSSWCCVLMKLSLYRTCMWDPGKDSVLLRPFAYLVIYCLCAISLASMCPPIFFVSSSGNVNPSAASFLSATHLNILSK